MEEAEGKGTWTLERPFCFWKGEKGTGVEEEQEAWVLWVVSGAGVGTGWEQQHR